MSAYKNQDENIAIGEKEFVNQFGLIVDELSGHMESSPSRVDRKSIIVKNPLM